MIVQCENCQTKFNVNETLLKPEGSKVKCSRCENIFKVYLPEQTEVEESVIDSSIQEEPEPDIEIESTDTEPDIEIESTDTEPDIEIESTDTEPDIEIESTDTEPEIEIEIESTEPESEIQMDSSDSGPEMDLDFDDSFEDDIMEDIEDLETEYREDPDGFGEEDLEPPSEEVEEIEEEESPLTPVLDKKKEGKSHTLPILCLIILVLVGGAYAVYTYAPDLIPSSILPKNKLTEKSKGLDVGARRLEILTVDGSFVNSNKSGRLFVISGKIRNNYLKSRDFILVKGCILDDKGGIVKEKTAFAGNVMKEEAFLDLSLEEIDAILKNRHGIENKNIDVEPGSAIDFMIVFDKLPDNLSEFTVGAVSSSSNNPETNTQD